MYIVWRSILKTRTFLQFFRCTLCNAFFLEMLLARVEYGKQILHHRLGARIAHNRFVCQSAKHEIHISSLLFFVVIILLMLLCVR